MHRGLPPPKGRLSKKPRAEARAARGGPSGGRAGGAVGRRRDAAGPEAGEQEDVGPGGTKTRGPLQARLRVDLPLRLRPSPERGGLLDDPAHGEHGAVLFGALGVRQGGGSRRRQAHLFGGGQSGVAHRRGGRDPGRDTPGVFAEGLPGAYAGGEVVAAYQRGTSQRALRGDRRDRGGIGATLRRTTRPARSHQRPRQLPLVAPDGMTLRRLFNRIRYQPVATGGEGKLLLPAPGSQLVEKTGGSERTVLGPFYALVEYDEAGVARVGKAREVVEAVVVQLVRGRALLAERAACA